MRISDWSSDVCSSDLLAAAIDAGLIRDVVIAKSERESDDFWRLRDSISEAERAEGPALQHDISVPVDLMPAFIAENPHRLERAFSGVRALSLDRKSTRLNSSH